MAIIIASFMPAVIGLLFSIWLASGAYRMLFSVRGPVSDALVFLSLAAILCAVLIVAPWPFSSLWLRYGVAGLLAIAAIRFAFSFWRTPSAPANIAARLSQGFIVLLGAVFGAAAVLGLGGYRLSADPAPADLAFPLQGHAFVIGQGGASVAINYHHAYRPQAYALDILAMNSLGRRTTNLIPAANEDYVIWDAQIVSPCDGEIVFARDGAADARGAQSERATPAGNMVAISCKGVTVLLAHMRQGSVAVAAGDKVKTGDPLGRVGNSGNTTEPHLHIHAERGEFQGEKSANPGAPITFDGRFLVRNDVVRAK